jgi:FkbM family methyltransferase
VVSRGEHHLDLIIRDAFFANAASGVFIDVGAATPAFLSLSALYRDLGWRVIAVEPNPVFCRTWREAGLDVLEYACGDRDEDDVLFELVDSHGSMYEGGRVSFEAFSSLRVKPEYRQAAGEELDVRPIKVRLRRLDTILAEHYPGLDRIDVVSVDVEGWELEVLQGFSLERYRPEVLVVENMLENDSYRSALANRGYRLWRHIRPNDVYVSG